MYGDRKRYSHDVLLRAKKGADALLLDMAIILLEVVRKMESNNGETGIVICAGLLVAV
jgi:hypothetical protein